jgi:hypothetical protein
MNLPNDLVVVDGRKESDSVVSVVFDVDGKRQTAVFRLDGGKNEIGVWNTVPDRNMYEILDEHGKDVLRRLVGVAARLLADEDVDFPLIYTNDTDG